jgi:hypothetical protein
MAEARLGGDVKAVFAVSASLMVVAALIDSGAVAWLLAPIILAGLVFCAVRAPLRHSLMTLMFFGLTLDNPVDRFAGGLYLSPFFKIGAALFDHLNNLTGIKAMFFSGSDIILAVLGVVGIMRESSRSRIDSQDRASTPRPLVRLARLSLIGAGYVWVAGMVRGGEFSWSLWQLQRVVYLPILFLLCHLGFRGPKDHVALAKLLLSAATLRAVMAIAIKHWVYAPYDPATGTADLPYATSHADSMLFASAFVVLVLLVIERAGKRALRLALVLLPLLAWGMAANNRRLVWVHVALTLLTLYVVGPDNAFKRKFRRRLYLALPLIAVYFAVGWNAGPSKLWKPVKIARSIVEPASDGSSLWRELENFNLIVTIKQSPIFGYGYGRRFIEAVPLPAVDYSLEYYLPHNSLLGLWAFAGFIGFTAMTLLWGGGVYFAMRGYHAAKLPSERVAAIVVVGAVLVYMVQAFGDLGLGSLTGIYILAPALAIGGKLATATGGWGGARTAGATAAGGAPGAAAPVAGGGYPELERGARARVG